MEKFQITKEGYQKLKFDNLYGCKESVIDGIKIGRASGRERG